MSAVTAGELLASKMASRSAALDRLRGLAIVCMVVDHLCIVLDGPTWVRMSVGRLAMPLFFLVSGHLVRRVTWRHAAIGAAGLLLPLAVPWIDRPNVLVLYAVGAAMIVGLRRVGLSMWLPVLLALAFMGNGLVIGGAGFFDPLALWALMAAGALLPRAAFDLGGRFPALCGAVGRWPLSWYLGHLLVLQALLYGVAR